MEKYKMINKDACKAFGGPEIVVEKKGSLDDLIMTAAESIKEMYRHFYPDTTVVGLNASHDLDDVEIDTIVKSFDETLGKKKQRLRTMVVFQNTVLIFASAEFKKVVEKIKKTENCKVEYRNPYLPELKNSNQTVVSNVYYKEGYAYFDICSMDDDDWDEENREWFTHQVFAIYWRPMEEGK